MRQKREGAPWWSKNAPSATGSFKVTRVTVCKQSRCLSACAARDLSQYASALATDLLCPLLLHSWLQPRGVC